MSEDQIMESDLAVRYLIERGLHIPVEQMNVTV